MHWQSFRSWSIAWSAVRCALACCAFALAAGCSSSPDSQSSAAEQAGRGAGASGAPAAGDGGASGGAAGDRDDGIALCSGCPSDARDPDDDQVRVHHVHLNVRDAEQAIAFYAQHFGAQRVRLNDRADALWAEPLLFLLDEGELTFSEELRFGFEHVGLGVPDPTAWFEAASARGVLVDARNGAPAAPLSFPIAAGSLPFLDPGVDTFSYVYVRGPNGERIEVWSGLAKFRHTHFMTPDIDATVAWYQQLLGVAPLQPMADPLALLSTNGISLDGVQLNFLAPMAPLDFIATDGQALDHIAFSVPDLDVAFEHARAIGAEIVAEPAQTELGFRSFFLRGPQEALLELVAAGPVRLP